MVVAANNRKENQLSHDEQEENESFLADVWQRTWEEALQKGIPNDIAVAQADREIDILYASGEELQRHGEVVAKLDAAVEDFAGNREFQSLAAKASRAMCAMARRISVMALAIEDMAKELDKIPYKDRGDSPAWPILARFIHNTSECREEDE